MVRKVVIAGDVCASIVLSACNTVRGAAADMNSAANCTENAINGGRC
mgnify:CR=1 FL=1